jgi:aspartate/methionine/tyrosine aminotransferase
MTTTVNPNIIEMEYAVRGPIPQRAAQLRKQGMVTIPCNIGNPQALGQKPITFYRQVLSLLEEPTRIERDRRLKRLARTRPQVFEGVGHRNFPSDYVLELAESMLAKFETGLGAYTESRGPLFIREAVANYIDKRDGALAAGGVTSDPDNVWLTDGASEAARFVLEMLIAERNDGIMIPIPQYPLYSATVRRCGGTQINYYPDEDRDWTLEKSALEESLTEAKRKGVRAKAIVVINPCNPTGAILDEQSIIDVIDFAAEHELAIIADEVYQHNLYGAEFLSFAKILGKRDVPLFSLHSTSKGFYGECGHRGGYLELRNPPNIEGCSAGFKDVLLKQASVALCSNTTGQALTCLMVSPPPEGSEPYEQFAHERDGVLADLWQKAAMIREAFKKMAGVECFGRTGAMYLFPRLNTLPEGTTDFDYCMQLLETTGLCTVNGSGFGQREGTHHLRVAFLPPKELLEKVLPRWIDFHNRYVGS